MKVLRSMHVMMMMMMMMVGVFMGEGYGQGEGSNGGYGQGEGNNGGYGQGQGSNGGYGQGQGNNGGNNGQGQGNNGGYGQGQGNNGGNNGGYGQGQGSNGGNNGGYGQGQGSNGGGNSECMNQLLPCLNYLNNNQGQGQNPPDSCCDPLKSVIKSNPDCLCSMISNQGTITAQIAGINVTKAQELPARCGQRVNPISCVTSTSRNTPGTSDSQNFGNSRIYLSYPLICLIYFLSMIF